MAADDYLFIKRNSGNTGFEEVLRPGAPVSIQTVADDAARFALTAGSGAGQAQAGDLVAVTATGNYYVVVDTDNLDTEAGYCALPPAGPAIVVVRQGTASELATIILESGELGYTTDTKQVLVGDGVTPGGNSVVPEVSISPATLTLIVAASDAVTGFGLTAIPDNWQNDASTLKGLSIGSSVTSIGDNSFSNCSGFTGSLSIPDSVLSIGSHAFYLCDGFTGNLTIGNSVTTIGSDAFAYCSGFTGTLTLGNSITEIGVRAFRECSGFAGSLRIPDSVLSIEEFAFGVAGFTGNLTIGNSVTAIGSYAFYLCAGFTGSLTLGNSVTTIGDAAFGSCSGFAGSLTIGNSVTAIGLLAFQGCAGFTGNLTLGNSVTTIGDAAFDSCGGFTGNLRIGDSVETIGEEAFYGCFGFSGDLTIPSSVTSMGYQAFFNCSGITNVICRTPLTVIGSSNCLYGTGVLTIHVLSTDASWTAGGGQEIAGREGVTVIKDLT